MRVAIIADDLTGTLDVAGPFATRGHATWAVVNPRACTREQFAGADVVSVNCASRHLPAAQAAAVVRDAIERLCPPQAEILLKKIDSTLRGNVVAETMAAMTASGRPNAVVAPAFPGQGRTVVRGMVYVAGVPLPQTGFARDALSPPPLEPLDHVFRAAAPGVRVESVSPQGHFLLAKRGEAQRVFVVDSLTDADLQHTVRALGAGLRDCVLVGSTGVAAAVAQTCPAGGERPARPRVSGQLLIAVGSRAEQSAAQVAALRAQPGVVLLDAPNGRLTHAAPPPSDAATVVLRATPGSDGREGDAEQVAALLAQGVVGLLRSGPVAALLATGGDTAVAILDALSRPALQVMGDLLPGIPYCRLDLDGRTLWLLTKAGGFGTRDTLIEVVALLRAQPSA
ncbi:MAG TPA: four-carbon acid sugar kinase family protein [Burkholderiales bacterium]|nr:four-carbon acid sugar kinase family protein [Burkholderiales bacterium]